MEKKTMSVIEMGKMIGIRKTDSYWLVKKKLFKTVNVLGKMRVDVNSFMKWLNSQSWYHIVEIDLTAVTAVVPLINEPTEEEVEEKLMEQRVALLNKEREAKEV